MKNEKKIEGKDEKEKQSRLIELKLLEGQLQKMQEQRIEISTKILEVEAAKETLKEIGNLKEKNEIMFPVGGGVLVKAAIIDKNKVLINAGAGVSIKKSLEDALSELEKQGELMSNMLRNLEREMDQVETYMQDSISKMQK